MGEIADWILEGGACQVCGKYLGGDEPGYPRTCAACRGTETADAAHPVKKIECMHPGCKKRFKTEEAAGQHYRDSHQRSKP